jgi:hypothetical protein
VSDDWEIVRDGIVSDEFGTRQVHLDLAALDRLKEQHDHDQKRIGMLEAKIGLAIEGLQLFADFVRIVETFRSSEQQLIKEHFERKETDEVHHTTDQRR